MANLGLRQADLNTAITDLKTCITNCETDIANADSDSFEIGRIRDRVQSAIQELGVLGTTGTAEPGQ